MKIFNIYLLISALAFTTISCSDNDSEDETPPQEDTTSFEENLSLDTWEVIANYSNPVGWETSNPGTTFISIANATEEKTDVVNGSAAKLETTSIGITGIASATIYTGRFELNLDNPASSAILGVPFDKRPSNFSFNYKYTPGDKYEQYDGAKGTEINGTDSCLVYMYLQKREGSKIERIGTAAMQSSETISEWTSKTLSVTYGEISNPTAGFKLRPEETGWASAETTPTHIIIVFASSSAGDYFRGAIGSLMYVDEISIKY